MTAFLSSPQLKFLGVAIFMLGAALSLIKWVGRTLREQIGAVPVRPEDAAVITHVDNVPAALVKQALERGMVTSAQLATMTAMERQFFFASLRDRLAAQAAHAETATDGAPASAAPGSTPRAISGAEFGMASMPAHERLTVHCPLCGELLALPAFPPFVAHCAQCGTRTAVREDVAGHYLLNVAPPQRPAVPRGPLIAS